MRLIQLLKGVLVESTDVPDIDIRSLHCRSTEVVPGGLFIAIKGYAADGHDFIEDAVVRGAVAVVAEKEIQMNVPVITVDNARRLLPLVASRFYGHPAREVTLIGITGTNGKTTTTYIVESILKTAGFVTGVIGTINYRYNGISHNADVTTPDALDLQRMLREMVNHQVTHVVMEASSHALVQGRVDHCPMDIGVFTNLTRDHLDFHADMEDYYRAKEKLFIHVLGSGPKASNACAVINADYSYGQRLLTALPVRAIAVGNQDICQVKPQKMKVTIDGISGVFKTAGGDIPIRSPLIGHHNLENLLCAVGAALALGISPETIANGISALQLVAGRLEPVENRCGIGVFVDYAHTPDALKNSLTAVRKLTRGRLISVFGCGGDRDRAKRPLMGKEALMQSDLAIITSDNPRSEPPMEIIKAIIPGADEAGGSELKKEDVASWKPKKGVADYIVEPDRRSAIGLAIAAAHSDDTVLIAGKGHETYQVLKEGVIDFDDRHEAAMALEVRSC